jgi:hypothetical protein
LASLLGFGHLISLCSSGCLSHGGGMMSAARRNHFAADELQVAYRGVQSRSRAALTRRQIPS